MTAQSSRPPCIIVTGSSGGIGSATLDILAQSPEFKGCTLIGLSLEAGDKKLSEGAGVITIQADVSQAESIDKIFSQINESYTILGLVNAAGLLHHGPALECSAQDLEKVLAVNALGVFNTSNAAARHMVADNQDPSLYRQRSIVTLASNAATGPRSLFSAYGASKAFASHYTRSLGLEIGQYGIRANVICPGTTLTPMLEPIWQGQDLSQETIAGSPEHYRNGIPLKKIARPEEIASVVHFLLSSASSHITLAELTADGGATQR